MIASNTPGLVESSPTSVNGKIVPTGDPSRWPTRSSGRRRTAGKLRDFGVNALDARLLAHSRPDAREASRADRGGLQARHEPRLNDPTGLRGYPEG